jgi:hypothetical protein
LRQVPNIRLPSEAEENRDPAAADDAYEAAVAWLRTATRDRARFPLVAQESVYFGFRRNLLALRLYVLLSIGLSEATNVAGGAHSYLESGTLPNPQVTLVTTLIALFSAFVLFGLNRSWARTAADAYAGQLLSACDQLAASGAKPSVSRRAPSVPKRATAKVEPKMP